MTVRMTVSTGNLRGLVANLYAADARAQKSMRTTVATYGEKQWRLTRKLAPYDETKPPGAFHLRDHIRLRFSDDGLVYEVGLRDEDFRDAGELSTITLQEGERVEVNYGLFLEFGTRFMAAQPFIFPARDQIWPEFKRALGANVRGAIRRRGR